MGSGWYDAIVSAYTIAELRCVPMRKLQEFPHHALIKGYITLDEWAAIARVTGYFYTLLDKESFTEYINSVTKAISIHLKKVSGAENYNGSDLVDFFLMVSDETVRNVYAERN
ncbi:MAG: hypothetical protein D6735_10615 [Acidobacteria bacterium]|nr:MAG: hypothetical protein D6735_10615 [Acidobacteriota bacterium]